MRVGTLTDGVDTWIVVDWDAVKEYSSGQTESFQVWIRVDGHRGRLASPTAPCRATATAASSPSAPRTCSAPRARPSTSTAPARFRRTAPQLVVTGTPGVTSSATLTYTAKGVWTGDYVNYAEVTGSAFDGIAIARFAGKVIR